MALLKLFLNNLWFLHTQEKMKTKQTKAIFFKFLHKTAGKKMVLFSF